MPLVLASRLLRHSGCRTGSVPSLFIHETICAGRRRQLELATGADDHMDGLLISAHREAGDQNSSDRTMPRSSALIDPSVD